MNAKNAKLALGLVLLALPALGGCSMMEIFSQEILGLRAQAVDSCYAADSRAQYEVTFDALWSAKTHPSPGFPETPHFSGLIGATHNDFAAFWKPGGIASPGIENMAETGSKSPLDAEINAAIAKGTAENLLSGSGISPSPGKASIEFSISGAYPLVTLVSMIAPSPDWFTGVQGLNLCAEGQWLKEFTLYLYPWDAGSDSGTFYTAADSETEPQEPIAEIKGFPFLVNGKNPPVGTFKFVRLSK